MGWIPTVLLLAAGSAQAVSFSGNVAVEAVAFAEEGRADQLDDNLTLSAQPKWSGEWNDGNDIWTVELFGRLDDKDSDRQHGDIRELTWLHIDGDNEWRVGINTVFWGVTESRHLVDVINQVDNLEGVDGEDKLGQPMVHFSTIRDWGTLELFVMPYFREREFRSVEGRPSLPLPVVTDQATFAADDEEQHVDAALRFSHILGDVELGLSYFSGTNRDPVLQQGLVDAAPVLIPHYEQIQQVGLDLQAIVEDWIWKLEVIHRETDSDDFQALVGGFEYSFYDINATGIDVGTLVEYLYDSRGDDADTPFNDDLFAGLRVAWNDEQSTELLAGTIVDLNNGSQSFRLEGNRRIGDNWKLSIEAQVFTQIDEDDPLQAFADDDFVLAEMAYYF